MKNIEIYELTAELIEKEFKVPERVRDKVWNEVEYNKHGIILNECRKHYRDPSKTTKLPIFKLRYVKKDELWSVYWQKADGRWYKLHEDTDISAVIEYIHKDQHGCFFG